MELPHEISQKKVAEILHEKGANPVCPYCGQNNWAIPKEASLVIQWTNKIPQPGIPVAAMICNNCGNVRLHALGPLDQLPSDAQASKGENDG